MAVGRIRLPLACLLLTAAVAVPSGPAHAAARPLPRHVWVWETDSTIAFSSATVRPGKVVFTIVNAGRHDHNFVIDGKVSSTVGPDSSTRIALTLKRGRHVYRSAVGSPGLHRLRGVLVAG